MVHHRFQAATDPETSVKNGTELLNQLIKDIVAETSAYSTANTEASKDAKFPHQETSLPRVPGSAPISTAAEIFNLPRFIPLLKERIQTLNPYTRMFILQWVYVLSTIPDLELLSFLPDFLEGLLGYLSDPNSDVRTATINVLSEFLKEIKEIVFLQTQQGKLNIRGRKRNHISPVKDTPDNDTQSDQFALPKEAVELDPLQPFKIQVDDQYVPGQGVVLDVCKIADILTPYMNSIGTFASASCSAYCRR